jgi:vacuolar-type H+-ATPase catalytic subunit A/Vma1
VVDKSNANRDYQISQNEIQKQTNALGDQNSQIASSQRIRNAGQQLSNMEQNIGFLGNRGKSRVAINATRTAYDNASTTYNELLKVEQNMQIMKELREDFDSASFEKRMVDLQDQLDSQVSLVLQSAINDFQSEVSNIDTLEEVQQVREKYFDSIDTNIEAVTNRQLFKMQENTRFYNQKLDTIKNKSTLNKDMSAVR